MQVIDSLSVMQKVRADLKGQSVGFVPTMGALHQGHARLLEVCRMENDISILSIFVNPTQFNNPDDLKKYPKTLEQDLTLAKSCGVDYVWLPQYADLYPDNYRYRVSENSFSQRLCGAHRPGHFDGVLTVVMRLLNVTQPQKAYFGEKDYQQLLLIQDMVKSFFMNIEVIPVPTVREESGLAMSSRNLRLSPEERKKASLIYQTITKSTSPEEATKILTENGFRVDYVEDHNNRRFVAAYLGEVRLIDNVQI